MRAKTECRRCGCGAILLLRESCARCADKARAILHAEGVCRDEMIVRKGKDAARFVRDMPRDEPDSYVISLADRYEGVIEAAVAQLKYDKELDDMYAFAEELEDQLQQAKVANQRSVIASALADVAKNEPPPCPGPAWLSDLDKLNDAVRDGRLVISEAVLEGYDVTTGEPRYIREYKGEPPPVVLNAGRHVGMSTVRKAYEAWTHAQSYEQPPVGAEVSYEVAKRHMFEAPEARYRILQSNMATQFRVDGARRLLWSDSGKLWQPEPSSPAVLSTVTWQRLPDVMREAWCEHEPPAIGEECDWATAKRDMQARKEARYDTAGAHTREYLMQGGRLFTRPLGGVWSQVPKTDDCDAAARWVRLA